MNGFFGVSVGTMISMVVHLGLFGGVYGFFMRKPAAPIVAELDLSMTPMQTLPANAGGGHGRPSEAWVTPKKGKAPAPTPVAAVPETKEEVAKQESAIACPEPCAETGTGTGGGGTGEGEGQYIPASDAARKPRWIKNFITSSDYPLIARQEGKDGRVVLTVLIDSDGRVRDAMRALDPRERYIVEQRMMADDELSLAEIGRRLGVSRERARQLEARAKKKLRRTLGDLAVQPVRACGRSRDGGGGLRLLLLAAGGKQNAGTQQAGGLQESTGGDLGHESPR
jgi:DNA-binding CsgD family transcriptional regulator